MFSRLCRYSKIFAITLWYSYILCFCIGKNCEEDINECESSPCKNSGICLERSNITLYQSKAIGSLNISLPEIFHKPFDFENVAGYILIWGTIL